MSKSGAPFTPIVTGDTELPPAVVTPETEGIGPNDAAPLVTDGRATPPVINDAINAIAEYEFDPRLGESTAQPEQDESEEVELAMAMMFSPTGTAIELPKLRTEQWPYTKSEPPNPISIGMARKLLGAGYAEIPCELEAAKDHGYAWIIEDEETWLKRGDGVEAIVPPTKPKEVTEFNVRAQFEYAIKSKRYTLYRHLCQEGRVKLQEWFGREVFLDLLKEGILPPAITPKQMLAHIAETYATPQNNRVYMETVDEQLNTPYNPKEPIEAYFLRLQEAKAHAKMLGVDYSRQQVINKALKQFEVQYGKDAQKAEKKWYERDPKERTWNDFKTYWKEQIHQWDVYAARGTSSKKEAHQVSDVQSLAETVTALQAEARSLQEGNAELVRQLRFHQAMQAEHSDTRGQGDDDTVSTLTNQIMEGVSKELERKLSCITIPTGGMQSNGSRSRSAELLHIAQNRNPRDTSHLNHGKGKRFTSYCWKCGCNCTHWTRKCLELSANERRKYKEADFDNLMGGSTKFLDRRGKFQSDYGFDSL